MEGGGVTRGAGAPAQAQPPHRYDAPKGQHEEVPGGAITMSCDYDDVSTMACARHKNSHDT